MFRYPNRLVCSVLEEMRNSVRGLNIFTYMRNRAILLSHIEEIQTYVNRMEAALEYKDDIKNLHKRRNELSKRLEEIEEGLDSIAPEKSKRASTFQDRLEELEINETTIREKLDEIDGEELC